MCLLEINCKTIFTATIEEHDERGIVARHLLAISQKQDPLQTVQALDDWNLASNKEYVLFAKKHPLNIQDNKRDKEITEMSEWCIKAEIQGNANIFY